MSSKKPSCGQVITDNTVLRAEYHALGAQDIFIGRLRLKPGEESILLDLTARGVQLFPSAISQQASRSKTFQARIFSKYMAPQTRVIYDVHDLLETVNRYGEHGIDRVVTKHDRRNAGMGIHLWDSIEEVYSQASFKVLPFPFVVQPFYLNSGDIRVIILGDYVEAYRRFNPNNFRNNLHCGGKSIPCSPTPDQLDICRKVMARGDFPYAHIDLMVTEAEEVFLAEINLRGGIRGAKIRQDEYRALIEEIHQNKRVAIEGN